MTELKIERDIEFPKPNSNSRYQFWRLEVGDGFRVEITDDKTTGQVRAAASGYSRKYGVKIRTRKVVQAGKEFMVVKRTA